MLLAIVLFKRLFELYFTRYKNNSKIQAHHPANIVTDNTKATLLINTIKYQNSPFESQM